MCQRELGSKINSLKIEMITMKESFQNKRATGCLLLENPKSYIVVILMKGYR